MLHKFGSALPAVRGIGGKAALLAAAALLSACAARQIDTQAFVDIPVEVPRLLVVYQPSQPGAEGAAPAASTAQREQLNDALGDSLEARLPDRLNAAGVNALFVRAANVTTVLNSKTARSAVSHVLYLRIQDDRQECSGAASCAYRVTLRATLLRSGAAPTLWRTDLQEAYFTSSRIDAARFDDLSEQLARAVAPMIRTPAPREPSAENADESR
ncbi:hypothetical protein Herbaro_16200 [Herbaspirillum sp. WKF16]|uniref:hypothetical protein n=1 Tax=Herbaspirillum sp. WKF16 TaxID=3028312 RepID=UPI0023A97A96|nr:hypothetical protein [Herbaspirillum sp. WKF16]WDZ95017.1 hypothetical protein Herbaro_16200 [Herbaspirillum sp. WKF16]